MWPGKSRHYACVGEGLPVGTRVIDTFQTLPLALIGCIKPGAVDSCKPNYSHWVEPQTVGFCTADLDHYDNNQK